MNLMALALDQNAKSASRIDAIRQLSESHSYSVFAQLWPLATSIEENTEIAEAAGRALATILNAGPQWDQGHMIHFSEGGTIGFLADYEGPW